MKGVILSLLIGGSLLCPSIVSGADRIFTLEKNSFLPADEHKSLLKVHQRTTLSIQVSSSLGASVQIEDRMSGVLAASGTPGTKDGRIDRTLDIGEYRVTVRRGSNDRERIGLNVRPFVEKNDTDQTGALLSLADGDIYSTTLGDLETRSFWIVAENDLYLEVIGRNLANCSLWRDGLWITDFRGMQSTFAPDGGNPKGYVEFSKSLDPGNYLLVCRGGPARTWSEDDIDDSLLIRSGAKYLGTNFKRTLTVSHFGRDAYLIGTGASYHEVQQNEKKKSRIYVAPLGAGGSRFRGRLSPYITPEGENDYAVLQTRYSGTYQWLVVEAAPGTEVELTSFSPSLTQSAASSKLPGYFLVSTLSSRGSADSIDLTGILVQGEEMLKSQAPPLDGDNPLVRRFNLDMRVGMMLDVGQDGTYRIIENEESGADAQYGFLDMNNREQVEPYYGDEGKYRLNEGEYLLVIDPLQVGILNFVIIRDGFLSFSAARARRLLNDLPAAIQDFIFWEEIQISKGDSAFVSLLERPGIVTGIDFRQLPVSPEEPLAVTLNPQEGANLAYEFTAPMLLAVHGSDFLLTEGGDRIGESEILSRGRHELHLQNTGTERAVYMVQGIKRPVAPPKPEVPRLRDILTFVSERQPIFADYGTGQRISYLLQVEEPGFYLLETSGRLSTEINVRSATETSLFSNSRNGDGQNARVSAYLKKGQYLVQVRTLGRSAGRAGLVLRRQKMKDAGALAAGGIARNDVEAHEVLKFRLDNTEPGDYLFSSYSPEVRYPLRIEEQDGWLVGTAAGSIRMKLGEGSFSAFSLAFPHDGRRINSYSRIVQAEPMRDSSGRPVLAANGNVDGLWRETEQRTPQEFAFHMPAGGTVSFRLTGRVVARMYAVNGNTPVLTLRENESESLDLEAGNYVFQVQAEEEDDRVPYGITASTEILMEGVPQARNRLPAVIDLSVERDGTYVIESFGGVDLAGELFDAVSGEMLARSDDRKSDWNILISRKLSRGRYQLRCSKSGIGSGNVTFVLTGRNELAVSAEKTDFRKKIDAGQAVVNLPVVTGNAGLYMFDIEGAAEFNIKLYREEDFLAESSEKIIVPLQGGTEYRIEFLVSSQSGGEIFAVGAALSTNDWDLSLSGGIASKSVAIRAFYRPGGNFELDSADSRTLLFTTGLEDPARPIGGKSVPIDGEGTWIVLDDLMPPITIESKERSLEAGQAAIYFSSGERHYFSVSEETEQATLLFADTPNGIPAIELGSTGGRYGTTVDWNAMSIHNGLTVAGFGGEGNYRGRVWSAAGGREIRIALRRERFPVSGEVEISQETLTLNPREAIKVNISGSGGFGTRNLSLLLARGTAAILQNSSGPYAVAFAAEGNREFLLPDEGGDMYLVNTLTRESLARLEYRAKADVQTLAPRESIELNPSASDHAQTLSIAKGGRWLAIMWDDDTDSQDIVLKGEDGRIYEGKPMTYEIPGKVFPPVGGILEVPNSATYMRIWITYSDEPMADLLASGVTSTSDGIRFPNARRFPELRDGYQITPEEGGVWHIDDADGSFFRLSATGPGLIWIHGPDGFERKRVSGIADLNVSAYLAESEYTVFYRPFEIDGRPSAGISASLLQPEPISENQDKRYFIRPGEEQVFIFEVSTEAKVGVGIVAEEEGPVGRLYDGDFRYLGEGPLLFRTLKPGNYLYLVQGVDKPVQYHPVVYGTGGSRRGIPEDVKEQYQGGAQ